MASEEEVFQEQPFTYKDKTKVEREFDRDCGWYNDYYPEHEYTIRLQGTKTYKEYVFTFEKRLEEKHPTLEELFTKTNNTYDLYEYHNGRKNMRTFKKFHCGKITSEGSEIELSPAHKDYDPDYNWTKHGVCKDYYILNHYLRKYKYGEPYDWEIEKQYKYDSDRKESILDQIIERLFDEKIGEFGSRNCLGYRVKKDGVMIENTISAKHLARYGEVPDF